MIADADSSQVTRAKFLVNNRPMLDHLRGTLPLFAALIVALALYAIMVPGFGVSDQHIFIGSIVGASFLGAGCSYDRFFRRGR
jgi:hypothetical protein